MMTHKSKGRSTKHPAAATHNSEAGAQSISSHKAAQAVLQRAAADQFGVRHAGWPENRARQQQQQFQVGRTTCSSHVTDICQTGLR
jgi:hypothetical protein